MKRGIPLLILLLLLPPAAAAPKNLVQIASLGDAREHIGLIVDKTRVFTFGTVDSPTQDGVLSQFDSAGTLIARKLLDSGGADFISAGTSDGAGNLWFVGASAAQALPSSVDTRTAINPDGVVVEAVPNLRSDLTTLTLWKYSLATGEVQRFSREFSSALLPTAISANAAGVSVVGSYLVKGAMQSFLLSSTPAGSFGKMMNVAGPNTTFNAISRSSDGTIDLFGSSTEKVGATTLKGKRDGILLKIKGEKIANVVRSSAPAAEREWFTVSGGGFLVGSVKSGKTTEIAATRFLQFKPIWTLRLNSTGAGQGLFNATGAYIFYSTSQGSTLATFTTKGIAGSVYQSGAIKTPVALAHSKELGTLLLGVTTSGAAIFTPTSG